MCAVPSPPPSPPLCKRLHEVSVDRSGQVSRSRRGRARRAGAAGPERHASRNRFDDACRSVDGSAPGSLGCPGAIDCNKTRRGVMEDGTLRGTRLGWVGTGRMGYSLASRLLQAGCDVAVYNRTRAKAEPLAEHGATIVDSPAELAEREIVFTMVAGPDDFKQVVAGPEGLLVAHRRRARSIDRRLDHGLPGASARCARRPRRARTSHLLAAPVSGNPKVVDAGLLTFVVSGPSPAYERVEPYPRPARSGRDLRRRGRAGPAGEDLPQPDARRRRPVAGRDHGARREGRDLARRPAGVHQQQRRWARCSPATRPRRIVKLDYSPTFTPVLLRKDFDLGFDAARTNSTCRCRSRRPPVSLSRR